MLRLLPIVSILFLSAFAQAETLSVTCGDGRDFTMVAEMNGGNSLPTVTKLVNDDVNWSNKVTLKDSTMNNGVLTIDLTFGGPLTYDLPNKPYSARITGRDCDRPFTAVASVSMIEPSGGYPISLSHCSCSFK